MSFNLLSLIPDKFHSEILTAFIEIISEADAGSSVVLSIREILDKITNLEAMLDPYRIPDEYLQHLADLIGATLAGDTEASAAVRRKELLRMIDWYKVKGTYQSMNIISLITGLTIQIYDKYTDDYSTFVDKAWFVGNESENPPGLGAGFYKSPHFGVSFLLNKVYPSGSQYEEGTLGRHLWRPSLFTGISDYIEKTRPVNTVPNYQLLSQHIAFEDGGISIIEDSEVATQIVGTWEYSKIFFDEKSSAAIYFDEDESNGDPLNRFDSSFEDFINSIDVWKLGTGGKDLTSSYIVHEISPIVLSGSLSTPDIYADRIEFKFSVDSATIQGDINELGLFKSAGDELIVMSTFPSIHKGAGTRLDFTVIIYRD